MSGRPPPPCPPSAATAALTRSTADSAPTQVVGDADGDAGAAFVDGDQRGDAAAEALLHRVDFTAEVLGVEAFDDLAEEGVAGDLLGAGGFGGAAAAHRQRLLGVGELALELAAFLDQRGDARRDFLGRGFEGRGGFAEALVAGVEPQARGLAGQRFDAADARGDRAFAE